MVTGKSLPIAQQVAVATCIGLSLFSGLIGLPVCTFGWFLSLEFVIFGPCILMYAVAGFLLAKDAYDRISPRIVWTGLIWSSLGLAYWISAAVGMLQDNSIDVFQWTILGIPLFLQSLNTISFLTLARRKSTSIEHELDNRRGGDATAAP
jgi:hypothetical protein